ncbi:MAG: DUF1285 domain-containing protein [Bdellovibrionales bacterium]|nr:DUF1285 domain-containing protein [Bdellovibrionales bacterium]
MDDSDIEKLYTSYLKKELFLNREGQWFHNGTAFTHKRLSELFHRSLVWDPELKEYVLRIGRGRATFSHEGFIRFVISLQEVEDQDAESCVRAHFIGGEVEALHPERLRLTEDESFVLLSEGRPPARLTRNAHQLLLEYGESERSIVMGGRTYTIPYFEGE